MKNRERYAQEMIGITLSGEPVAISLKDNTPITCFLYDCKNCLRKITDDQGDVCDCSLERLREWAEAEYNEKPIKKESGH